MTATSLFSTQIIFPPQTGGDGLSVGLSRQRFLGEWPDYRAVILGPSAAEADGDGADVQLLPHDVVRPGPQHQHDSQYRHDFQHRSDAEPRPGFEPRWQGLALSACSSQTRSTWAEARRQTEKSNVNCADLLCLGVDAFGELVTWVPAHDGPVLTVRGSAQSGKTEVATMIGRQSAHWEGSSADHAADPAADSASAQPILSVHDDAHLGTDPAAFDLLDGGLHLITMPVRFSPGYGSPLSKAHELGPLLVLGTHSRQDLANLGLLRSAPLDGEPGTAWFVTETRARPIRLFPVPTYAGTDDPEATATFAATAPGGTASGGTVSGGTASVRTTPGGIGPDMTGPGQEISAGGPARVS